MRPPLPEIFVAGKIPADDTVEGGTGSRNLTAAGAQAIRALFDRSF